MESVAKGTVESLSPETFASTLPSKRRALSLLNPIDGRKSGVLLMQCLSDYAAVTIIPLVSLDEQLQLDAIGSCVISVADHN